MSGSSSSTHCAIDLEVSLQPWFLPRKVADAIRGMIPANYRRRMHNYFDDYGCMICGREERYYSNGMCLPCFEKVRGRLESSIARRSRSKSDPRLDLLMFRQQKLAKRLLKSLVPDNKTPAQRLPLQMFRRMNPVDEAFSVYRE